jgi:hypothetical protein
MTLRRDIHAALDAVTPVMPPYVPAVVLKEVRSVKPTARVSWAVPLAALGAFAVVVVVVTSWQVWSRAVTRPETVPAATPVHLVFTQWISDPTVAGGPHPGFRPAPIAIGAHPVSSASAHQVVDRQGLWVVDIDFDAVATAALAQATSAAAAACPGDCPQRHIPIWANLTSSDVSQWKDIADSVSRPYSVGGKLVADPYISEPITGGHVEISGGMTEAQAKALAAALQQ